jgi:hypothetical protein
MACHDMTPRDVRERSPPLPIHPEIDDKGKPTTKAQNPNLQSGKGGAPSIP